MAPGQPIAGLPLGVAGRQERARGYLIDGFAGIRRTIRRMVYDAAVTASHGCATRAWNCHTRA